MINTKSSLKNTTFDYFHNKYLDSTLNLKSVNLKNILSDINQKNDKLCQSLNDENLFLLKDCQTLGNGIIYRGFMFAVTEILNKNKNYDELLDPKKITEFMKKTFFHDEFSLNQVIQLSLRILIDKFHDNNIDLIRNFDSEISNVFIANLICYPLLFIIIFGFFLPKIKKVLKGMNQSFQLISYKRVKNDEVLINLVKKIAFSN